MSYEYGIVILKPDGNKKEVLENLLSYLKDQQMDIIKIKHLLLKREDVIQNFAANEIDIDVYADYMCSGEICAVIVHGQMAGIRLQKIKKDFRERYGLSRETTANMIHTSDQGNEYYLQFPIFFPELDPLQYCAYADLNALFDGDLKAGLALLRDAERNSNLTYLGFIMQAGMPYDVVERYYASGGKLKILPGLRHEYTIGNTVCGVIGYLPKEYVVAPVPQQTVLRGDVRDYIGWIKGLGGIVILDYLPIERFDTDFINLLSELGFAGVMTYDPRRTLIDVEDLEDRIIDAGLVNTGGSNGWARVGQLTIGEYEFQEIYKLMGKERG